MRPRLLDWLAWLLVVGMGLGCQGNISDAGGSETGSAGDPSHLLLPVRIWRLTPDQFNAEVTRLFGADAPQSNLPVGAPEHNITNIAAGARIDTGNAGMFLDAVRSIATWAATNGEAAARCDNYGDPECIDTFLDWFPESAYRRPVSSEERAALRALFDDLAQEYDYDYAFSGVVRAVLLSPLFLYRLELGNDDSQISELDQYEIASLLGFGITNAAPDEMLLADAAAGRLDDPDTREAHARRLMSESSALWKRFFWEWLAMATLESQGNEVGLSPTLVGQMAEEYEAFVTEIVVTQRGTLRDLLTTSQTFARPELATYYDAEHPGGGLEQIDLDPTQRRGLLTQAAWLVSHGVDGRSNVVRRGMGIFREAMCHDIKPLNIDLQAELAKIVEPTAPVREIVEARGTHPTCGACHNVADPIGLAFESFGGDGRWQTSYPSDGLPVETAIEIDGVGPLAGAAELSAALAEDAAFQQCLVQRFAHYLLGADVGSPDSVRWTRDAHATFVASGGSFEELLVAMVRDPAFIERSK